MAVKAGPKKAADLSPLPWSPRSEGAAQFRLFAQKFLTIPAGRDAGKPFPVRDWQEELVKDLFVDDVDVALWSIPRGNAKSTLTAAIALYFLFMSGEQGNTIGIVAQDDASARRLLRTCTQMVAASPELEERCTIYANRIVVDRTDSTLVALAATMTAIEGSSFSPMAIVDEIGFVPKDVWESVVLSTGKASDGKILAMGTPSPPKWRDISPMWGLVVEGRAGKPEIALHEIGADPKLPIDDPKTWAAANPAYGDWMTEKSIRAQLPPMTREAEFRRARLGQWVEQSSEPLIPVEKWRGCARKGVRIPHGSKVVVAFDGSHNGDSTAIVLASVSKKPHFQLVRIWKPGEEADGQVPVLEVEETIKDLAREYEVMEVVADPFRWAGMLQSLDRAGIPVSTFPQDPRRMSPATADFRAAVNGGLLTHADDPEMNTHVIRAALEESRQGLRIVKPTKKEKIDAAICVVMGLSRAQWLAGIRKKKARGYKTL